MTSTLSSTLFGPAGASDLSNCLEKWVTKGKMAVPANLRLANQRLVIEHLLRGHSTRAGLAKTTGMSAPTVGKIVDELVQAKVVEELSEKPDSGEIPSKTLGRPGKWLRLARDERRFIAMHIGVKATGVAAVPAAVPYNSGWELTFKTADSESAWSARLQAIADEVRLRDPWGVLVSVPGIIDEEKGRVLLSPNLHWLEHADLEKLLQRIWPDASVRLVQDVGSLALGELTNEGSPDSFLLVDITQGLGAAAVIDRRLFRGPLPLVTELGHTRVVGNNRHCGCGSVGCIETLIGEGGLLRSYVEAGADEDAGWVDLIQRLRGHPVPAWLEPTLDAAGMVIGGALNVLGVKNLVLTGPFLELGDAVAEELSAAVKRSSMWNRFDAITVVTAPRRRISGLALAGIQRLVIPADWNKVRDAAGAGPAV